MRMRSDNQDDSARQSGWVTRRSAYGRASPALQPTCASARFPRGTSLRLR